ncbi:MAG: aldehyde dehydrogenase [Alphaproteobacteria bacterium]
MNKPMDHAFWTAQAEALKPRTNAFVGGAFAPAASGKTFTKTSPVDGRVLAEVAYCEAEDVDRAVATAREVFERGDWSRQAPAARKKVLLRWADLIDANAVELAITETLDMGKPISDSMNIDVRATANCIRWYAEAIDKIYDEVAPTHPDVVAMILREPLGVVAAVVPWNFPMIMAAWKLGPALAAGNSVILKPAEQSPLTALRLGELAVEAGMPPGVFNVLPGYGETAGQALGRHMDVDMIAFTGSTEVGKYFLRYSGESNMKRVALECGGKSPHIIMPDYGDLERAAKAAAWGIFFNQGEVCSAGSRLLVHQDIRTDFLDLVAEEAKKLEPGDPLDPATKMGALVSEEQTGRVLDYIKRGNEEGAALHSGGNRTRADSGGCYVEPTIFDNVRNDMTIAQEEIFGPVLATLKFDSVEEAIHIANDTIYGLAAMLWTDDLTTAHKAARAIKAGCVYINTEDGGDITTPFGGFKQSGFGRDKSIHAIEKYSDLKTVWIQM